MDLGLGSHHPLGVALVLLLVSSATSRTTTKITGDKLEPEEVRDLRIGSMELTYSSQLPADRAKRARQNKLVNMVVELVGVARGSQSLGWAGPAKDRDHPIPPAGFRSMGQWGREGSDILAAQVRVQRGGESLAAFEVEQVLGIGGRSVAENYSVDRELESLVEAVARSIAYKVAPRGTREPLLDIGKRELIEGVIQLLYDCHKLSFGKRMKNSSMRKPDTGLSSLRKRPELCRRIL